MIHVLATVELNPGRRDEFLVEFRRLVPLVRAERGCLEYGPAVDIPTDIPTQVAPRGDVVVVIEKWDSVESLKAHLVAPHMVEYRPKVRGLVVRTVLHILQPASE